MSFPTITFAGVVYTCPFSRRFRRHTDEESTDLRTTIATDGVEIAIRVYCDTTLGLPNCVLDGEGRLSAAVAVGAPPDRVPLQYVGELTTEETYRKAKILNDKRPHDDPEAIRKRRAERMERVVEARSEGKSLWWTPKTGPPDKGGCRDNIFVERLWRSAKYEYAYPCGPATVLELESGSGDYFGFYNQRRIHQSLDYRTPR